MPASSVPRPTIHVSREMPRKPRDLSEHLGGVLKIDRLLVVGSDQVSCGDALPALLDHLLGRFVRISGECQHVDRPSQSVHLLYEQCRDDDGSLRVAEGHHASQGFGNADDREVGAADLDRFARRIFSAGEEVAPDLKSDYADFALAQFIDFVQVAPHENLLGGDLLHVGRVAHQSEFAFVVLVAHVALVAPANGRDVFDAGQFPERFQVVPVQFPATARRHTFVWDGGAVGHDENGVGGRTAQLGAEHAAQPRAGTQQDDQHEDTPEDTQRRHDAAPAVAGDRLPDFVPAIRIEKSCHSLVPYLAVIFFVSSFLSVVVARQRAY